MLRTESRLWQSPMSVKLASNGLAYLNVGCGGHFSGEWNNLDLHGPPEVTNHDVRKALPFAAEIFDAVYSSHVLEHLDPRQGEFFLREQWRVLKPGGICRIAVPDLEKICRDYLQHLEQAEKDPSRVLDYQWTVLQLVDQMVREECGGEMLRVLRDRRFNPDFVRKQVGDEAAVFLDAPSTPDAPPTMLQDVKRQVKRLLGRNARSQGEAHRWMYDRLSLRLLLNKIGFAQFRVVTHQESSIPAWNRFFLDTAKDGKGPRKPDSLFVEAEKSVQAPSSPAP